MLIAFLFLLGLVLVVLGAELFVRGASALATILGVSPLVIGLTVVAYGTSAPELAVSVYSSYQGSAELAVGNVVGSNICNVLLILGVSALIVPLRVSRQLIRLEVPLMITVSVLFAIFAYGGTIGRAEGIILSAMCIAYSAWSIRQGRRETALETGTASDDAPGSASTKQIGIPAAAGFVAIGLVMLVLGSQWVVQGAVAIATYFGVSKLVIGLTIVAIGTSLPELATSAVAGYRGQRDIAVGNVIGSNIFNILLVVGLSAIVAPAGLEVTNVAMRFDIPVMLAVAALCLPIFFTGSSISRGEGAFFVIYYVAYTAYLIFRGSGTSELTTTDTMIMVLIVPLAVATVLTLIRPLTRTPS